MIFMLSILGILSVVFLIKRRIKKFHVDMDPIEMKVMGCNIFPLLHFMMTVMPDTMRRQSITKKNAPKPGVNIPRDWYDLTGASPYTIEEVKQGKIWQVKYEKENLALSDKKAKEEAKAFGMDVTSEKFREKVLKSAALFGEDVLDVAEKDIETAKYWYNRESITNEEIFQAGSFPVVNMFVVKLNSGGLLLYAPVRIRQEVGVGDWLASLGPVEWIVVASSYHTLNIQAAAQQYPEAKIVGAPAAEAKLQFVNALVRYKFDVDITNQSELQTANSVLEKEGVKLHYVDGDVVTDSILAIAHNVALECDLVYTHHDAEGFLHMDREEFRKLEPGHWNERLFKFCLLAKPNSPHGFLPNYRYQMMDPNSLGAMSFVQPATDGSTCAVMANSLRRILKLEFEFALEVHISRQSSEDFRRNVNVNWDWLDGQSLI